MEDHEYLSHLSLVDKWPPELLPKYIQGSVTKMVDAEPCAEYPAVVNSICSKQESFIRAAAGGILKDLLSLYSKDTINYQNSKGQTALMVACINSRIYAIQFLLAKEAKIDIFDETGNSGLHYACLNDDTDVLEALLKKVDINLKNAYGQNLLHMAVKHEKLKTLDLLLQSKKIIINDKDSSGNTAVHIAVIDGNVKILMKLLKHDIDLTIYNNDGMNPFNLAVLYNNLECLRILIDCDKGKKAMYCKTKNQESNFQMAVRFKFSTIVDYLLLLKDNSIVTCEIDEQFGYTCLHWATLQKNKDLIDRILFANERLINVKNRSGFTALDHFVNMYEGSKRNQNDMIDIFITFINHGADIDLVQNRDGIKGLIRDMCTLKF